MFNVNEYFEGKVMSMSFKSEEGPATIGIMDIGEYEFSTSNKEIMTVTSGSMMVKLPKSNEFKEYKSNDTFIVAANEKFQVKINVQTAYICYYK